MKPAILVGGQAVIEVLKYAFGDGYEKISGKKYIAEAIG
tara:strand:+ start:224 stop:340 length:117 start_codon:yes stop_codon:yes gene_type:complete